MTRKARSNGIGLATLLYIFACIYESSVFAASAPASESVDQLYEKAKKEGGQITGGRSSFQSGHRGDSAGIHEEISRRDGKPHRCDADQLLARVLAEARGGRVLADVFGGSLPYMAQIVDQKLLAPLALPEAAAYPGTLKSDLWVATDMQFYIVGWNTNLVKKGDEPNSFEDLANAKWKDTMMAEARDFQMLIGLAKRKYNNDEKAIDLFKRIAANQVEFHKGHSQLVEFLVAGQRPVRLTCYSHHFPPRMKKGAPIQAMLTEGIGEIGGAVSLLKNAPHPSAGLLWARWAISEEGQRVWAQAGETPAHPHVEPLEKVRPVAAYMLGIDDIREFPKYDKLWKEIFQMR